MSKILGVLSPLGLGGSTSSRNDDDITDRLSRSYTVILLVVFAIVVSTKQYVGDPIQCWVPAYFSSNYEDYTNKICWVSNTYYSPFETGLPKEGDPKKEVVYYQWVPMILLSQALFFYLPYTVWSMLNPRAGIDIGGIVEAAKAMPETENNEKTIRYIVRQMDRFCGSFRLPQRGCCGTCKNALAKRCFLFCGRKYGNFLVMLYLFVKLLFVINAIGQFFLLNAFLGTDYHLYGIHVIKSLILNEDWQAAERFPRETLCDFRVRQLGNIHRYTVQCVLPINLFNEKIYIFVWFWFIFVSFTTTVGLVVWLCKVVFRVDHMNFIKTYLKSMDKLERLDDKKTLRRFVTRYLRPDGILVIRLMALNTNDLVAAEIVAELWDYFRSNPPLWQRDRDDDIDDV